MLSYVNLHNVFKTGNMKTNALYEIQTRNAFASEIPQQQKNSLIHFMKWDHCILEATSMVARGWHFTRPCFSRRVWVFRLRAGSLAQQLDRCAAVHTLMSSRATLTTLPRPWVTRDGPGNTFAHQLPPPTSLPSQPGDHIDRFNGIGPARYSHDWALDLVINPRQYDLLF